LRGKQREQAFSVGFQEVRIFHDAPQQLPEELFLCAAFAASAIRGAAS